MRYLIDFVLLLALILGSPFFIFKMITAGKYRRGLAQRFGAVPDLRDREVIWVHAVSVGELRLSEPFVAGLRKQYPDHTIAISHVTRTGEEVAAMLYPDLPCFYFPLDFSYAVGRTLRRIDPALIVLVELELWPNFLLTAGKRDTPIVLANGRISKRSSEGYAKHSWLFKGAFASLTRVAVQDETYARRMTALFDKMKLPTERISIAGNMKFEASPISTDDASREAFRRLFGIADHELLFVAGSTHPGEHEHFPVLYKVWRETGLKIRMVIVPRHPERRDAVRQAFGDHHVVLVERSTLTENKPLPSAGDANVPPVVLLDTMGELGKLYHAADIVFVGGSLIPHGGQNMLEPAAVGVPVLFGPHTENFKTIVKDLFRNDAALEVDSLDQLEATVRDLADDPKRRQELGANAQKMVASGYGAVEKHLRLVAEVLDPRSTQKTP